MSLLSNSFWEDSKMFTVYDITRSALKKHLKKECCGLSIDKVDKIIEVIESMKDTSRAKPRGLF